MRIFVTGATGFIGEALVKALVAGGHGVTGLARSEAKAESLKALGAAAVRGELADGKAWQAAAGEHDALVHAAADHSLADGARLDAAAIDALLQAASSGKPKAFIYTSGVWVLGNCPGGAAEDASTAAPFAGVAWRVAHEERVLAAQRDGFATAVLRPGLVYGGHGSLTAAWFSSAQQAKASRVVGDGNNHVPYVHREDLAQLYLRILERAAGGVFHGVDGAALTQAEAATAASVAAGAGGNIRALPLEQARQELGAMAEAICLDQVVRTPRALALGWKPVHESFAAGARRAFAEWQLAAKH